MIRHRWCLGAVLVPFCTIVVSAASVIQVDEAKEPPDNRNNNSPWQTSLMQRGKESELDLKDRHDPDEAIPPETKLVFKREAKRPKNKKRRLKFSKKKMQQINDNSEESKLDSKSVNLRTKSIKTEDSGTVPEFSELYMPWNLPPRARRSRHPKKSEAKSHPSEISTCEDPTEEMYDPPRRYEKEVFFED